MSDTSGIQPPNPGLPRFPAAPPSAEPDGEVEAPPQERSNGGEVRRRVLIGVAVALVVLVVGAGVAVIVNLRGDLDDERDQVTSLQRDKAGLSEELAGTKDDLSSTEDDLSATQDDLSSTQADLTMADADLDTCRSALEKANEAAGLLADALGYVGVGLSGDLYSLNVATSGLDDVSAQLGPVADQWKALGNQCGVPTP